MVIRSVTYSLGLPRILNTTETSNPSASKSAIKRYTSKAVYQWFPVYGIRVQALRIGSSGATTHDVQNTAATHDTFASTGRTKATPRPNPIPRNHTRTIPRSPFFRNRKSYQVYTRYASAFLYWAKNTPRTGTTTCEESQQPCTTPHL